MNMQCAPCNRTLCDAELEASLARLLQAAKLGDVAAFESFYGATIRLVLPAVRRVCGEPRCEDALADAYFQAWRTLASFDASRGSALAWIKVIALSRARDCMRAERLRHGGADGAVAWDEEEEVDGSAGPEQIAETAQASALLRTAIAQLPARQRMLIGLAYYSELTQGELAQQTGLSLGAVKSSMRDSYARLRGILAPSSEVLLP